MQTKYDELRLSGQRSRLTYRDQEPDDPAQHELWRLENAIEDGMLLDTTRELTDEETFALGKLRNFLKKMCGRRRVCTGCPHIPVINRLGYGDCIEYACVQVLIRERKR